MFVLSVLALIVPSSRKISGVLLYQTVYITPGADLCISSRSSEDSTHKNFGTDGLQKANINNKRTQGSCSSVGDINVAGDEESL
eukprot:snap_masked-scaffold_2-processed-gene-0.40-mRNA-1 protein AED:1.00 eAED:1.00 QI:0/0/0/0/1/1/2/0/83